LREACQDSGLIARAPDAGFDAGKRCEERQPDDLIRAGFFLHTLALRRNGFAWTE
jgi:hypothetical protein